MQRFVAMVFTMGVLAGCGGRELPLAPLGAQSAVVGVELDVVVRTQSGEAAVFNWDADLALRNRLLAPTLTAMDGSAALFRWTPLASDVGTHELRFIATANGASTLQVVPVTVTGGPTPLVFREPVGDGTTLDVSRAPCVEVPVQVEDGGATAVSLIPALPLPEGATLTPTGPLTGELRFCPTAAQLEAAGIYRFALVATDANGGRADKSYRIVIGGSVESTPAPAPPPAPGCDGGVDCAPEGNS